jgi:two-component system cell cycle sensor histidine kinase/response regulator CckA
MVESVAPTLRESARTIRATTGSAQDAIVLMDDRGVVTSWSPAAETLFGYTAQEAIGRDLPDLIVPEPQRSAFRAAFRAFRQSGPGRTIGRTLELRARRKDGREIAASLSLSAMEITGHWHTVGIARDLTAHQASEDALQRSEARFHDLFQHAALGIYRASPDGRFLEANAALLAMLGYDSASELRPLSIADDVFADPEHRLQLWAEIEQHPTSQAEAKWRRKDGGIITVLINARAVRDAGGALECIEVFVEDVTGRRSLEDQFLHAQRMEAVGRLAGGVAHDFNNVLTVIITVSELLLGDLPAGDPKREDVEDIRAAALRAAALTRQLLTFSRKQVVQPRVLSVHAVVEGVAGMLQRLVGDDVTVAVSLGSEPQPVRTDPGQLEQIIMNLVVNARDAMPDGGRVTLATSTVVLDEAFAQAHPGASPGPHVLLEVRDTGIGMSPEVLGHVFEPFFTTKGEGKGTGLGLATVYGIVQQLGGAIDIASAPGSGTTFRTYLPCVDAPLEEAPTGAGAPPVPRGHETLLLVEDDAAVRLVIGDTLRSHGYHVLVAPDGRKALEAAAAESGPISLVLTDVLMPEMSGPEVARALGVSRPGVRVVYMSGYTDDEVSRHGVLEAGVRYLQKPFDAKVLARAVREALDGT